MFFKLYLSELIRIKNILITLVVLVLSSQALDAIYYRNVFYSQGISNFSITGTWGTLGILLVILNICTSVFLFFLLPILYVRQYMRNKEYFLSYPISSLKKSLLIFAIPFSIIIACLVFSLIPILIFDGFHHTYMLLKSIITSFSHPYSWLLIVWEILLVVFLINISTFKKLILLFIFGGPTCVNIGFHIWKHILPADFAKPSLYDILFHAKHFMSEISYLIVLVILYVGVGYMRISRMQTDSNRYVLHYFIILGIGLFISPLIAGITFLII